MKYKNANKVLPNDLVNLLQEYVQGEYLYIPIKNRYKALNVETEYKTELIKRDSKIYTKHLEGVSNKRLARQYNLSESSIRRIILKQRERYITVKDKIRNVLYNWNLQGNDVEQIYDTTWMIGNKYVLKVYSDLDMMKRNLSIMKALDEKKIPVGKVVYTCSEQEYVYDNEFAYFLSEKLCGSNIVNIVKDRNIAVKMGETLAVLHAAFVKCEDMGEFWNNSLLEEMKGWIKTVFEKNNWRYIGYEEYAAVVSKLESVYDKLPIQLIHRDVHFGNFLFENGEFTGYIDFDLSQKNIRIFDLCYFLTGLLSEEEKIDISKETWLEVVQRVFSGYESKNKLSHEEKSIVPCVMMCIELLFMAWFEEQEDVQCVENAHSIYLFVKDHEDEIHKYIK